MKYFLLTFLILFLIGAAFGFTLMGHETSSHGAVATSNCTIPILDSSICTGGVFSMATHHISAFQSFSQVNVSYFWASILLLFSLFIIAILLVSREFLNLHSQYLPFLFLRLKFETIGRNTNHRVLNWLSLFENSPSSIH